MSLYAEHNKPMKELVEREMVTKIEYDYQINARAQTMRVIAFALARLEENHEHHTKYDEYDSYKDSALECDNLQAIRLLKTSLGL